MKVIRLKNAKNIRDLGGQYSTVKLKEGMLIRGTALLHLSEEDKHSLVNTYNVKTIVDLRSSEEQQEDVEQDIPSAVHLSLPVFEREQQGISHNENEKADRMHIYKKLPQMKDIYREMVHGESLDNIGKIIKKIVTSKPEEFGIYFHCSEGKDRTGVIAAILLLLLGVTRKEIVQDYLYTNKVNNKKAFKYYMAIKYLKFKPVFALKVGRLFIAKKLYINQLFKIIYDEYQGEEKFFSEAMKLTKEEIDNFRSLMIA